MDEPASTRREILSRLRHRPMTIAELAQELGLTRNAILMPLADMEAKGLIRRREAERTGRAGKPAQRYEISPEEFEKASPAYRALAPHLLAVIASASPGDVARAMDAMGQSMHRELAAALGAEGAVGLGPALEFLSSQGAKIEVIEEGGDTLVLSHSCPIGQLVRTDRCICSAIAAFLARAADAKARAECVYGDKLTCRFRLEKRFSEQGNPAGGIAADAV